MVSDDLADWMVQNYLWHGAIFGPAPLELVVPTKRFFSAPGGTGEATARAVIEDLKRILAMQARNFQLHPLPEIPEDLHRGYSELGEVAGTYQYDPDRPVISYRPTQMRRPVLFINTMVHEMMHDRLAPFADVLPGGVEAHELATDLHCIINGFGIFQLNAAEQAGWAGYMTQPSRAYALALFLELNKIPRSDAAERLASRPRKLLKQALAMKRLDADVAEIQSAYG